MSNRWLNLAIIALWLASMTWLVVAKVLPPLLVGEPPSYASMLDGGPQHLAWDILLDDRRVGEARSTLEDRGGLTSQLTSDVRLDGLPLDKVTPPWMVPLMKAMGGVNLAGAEISLHAQSWINIDPLGQLIDFTTALSFGELHDFVQIHGEVDEGRLPIEVRCGDLRTRTMGYLPPSGMISDALSPQGRLPGLRVGQRWTEPVYSPLRPGNSPMEILQVSVERQEPLEWQGTLVPTLVVEYRNDAGAKLGADDRVRGRMWVHPRGDVLKQEMYLLETRLIFVRKTPLDGARSEKAVAARTPVSADERGAP
ncbi:MAG: hypothetical protein K1X74_12030 [Pirellulales bacterium]|nr:hypothetical protein [Pirellulales bacterium]